MEARVSYTLVGLFVVILGAGGVIGGLWLAQGLDTEQYQYYSVFTAESVAGLSRDAPVTYRGVDVGQVTQISIDREYPQRIHLLLRVQQDTPVRQGTTATLKMRGLTGISYVELSGARADAAPLQAPPDKPYPVIPFEETLLTRLDTAVTQGLETLSTLGDELSALLDENNRNALAETLNNLHTVSAALADNDTNIRDSLSELQRLLGSGADTMERLPATLQRLDKAIGQVDRTARSLQQAGDEFGTLGRQGQEGVDRILSTTVPEANALLSDLRRLSARLAELTSTLERDPSLLLFGREPRRSGPGEGRR
jgi:phospholipid/cholesterol/gamma-HCH transport system substrate-binding protein